MLTPILIRKRNTVFQMLLERRVDHQLLANRVPGKLPGEHILVLRLLIFISWLGDAVVVRLDLAVVLFDGVDDARGAHDGWMGDGAFGEWGWKDELLVEDLADGHCGSLVWGVW